MKRRQIAPLRVAAMVCVVVLAAGCVDAVVRDEQPLVAGTTPTSGLSSPSDADVAERIEKVNPRDLEAAVLAAYRHNWTVINDAYAAQNVAGLHRVASGPLLYGFTDDILYDIRIGIVVDGQITVHPTIESVAGDSAVVTDCWVTEDEVRDTLSGDVLGEYWSSYELRVELVFDNDLWKLYDLTIIAESCEPPPPVI